MDVRFVLFGVDVVVVLVWFVCYIVGFVYWCGLCVYRCGFLFVCMICVFIVVVCGSYRGQYRHQMREM